MHLDPAAVRDMHPLFAGIVFGALFLIVVLAWVWPLCPHHGRKCPMFEKEKPGAGTRDRLFGHEVTPDPAADTDDPPAGDP